MRGNLEVKKKKMNKQGQVLIINLLILVMTIVVFAAMLPILSETLNSTKDQSSLNCPSNINKCETNDAIPCYNSSIQKQTIACSMIDLYVPYIVIVVLIAGVAKLMANRIESFSAATQAPYPAY